MQKALMFDWFYQVIEVWGKAGARRRRTNASGG